MKPDRKQEAQRWLRQAEYQLASAQYLLSGGYYAMACFHSQQNVEVALKALRYLRGDRYVLGHAVTELFDNLVADYPELVPHRQQAIKLDRYYIPTRYPDAIPGGVPAEGYDAREAAEAVSVALDITLLAKRLIEGA
ncbi:MAG: HEPN domain-containing protein [Chloroflexi bacterium]|nr:HEPN domain-containing protein [Chloroflexota bacterium]